MPVKIFSNALAITLFLLLANNSVVAGKLEVHDAWVREAPPAAKVMAAYLTLHNHSAVTYTLDNLSSPDFKKVEIHRSEQHEGMSKMIPVSHVIVSPEGSVNFQPGGMHLMLIDPKKRHKAGDKIRLTLNFTNEIPLKISLPVKKAAASNHGIHADQQSSTSHQH